MSSIQNIQEQLKGLSVEELLAVITAAAAEAKKAAKSVPKVKEAKEKKGSMPKGVVPPQLHKPRAWVDFVLADANTRGWPAIAVKGQEEPLPASVERDGQFVFESTGKPLNNKQAMSLSKQYWDRKAATGTHPKLYEVFEGQYVAPEPAAPKEAVEADEVKVEEAPKPKKAAKKSEEEKAAEKLQKEAEKQAKKEAAKAEKEAAKPKKEAKKEAEKPVVVEEAKEEVKEAPKPKKVVKKVAKKEEEAPFECEDDGQCREWVLKGKKVYRDFEGHMWERTEEGEAGPWMGKYDAATKTLDASAEEPVCEDE